MVKERLYRGFYGYYENGRPYIVGEFEYYSKHKNYSKKNMEDMKNYYIKHYSFKNINNIYFEFGTIVN